MKTILHHAKRHFDERYVKPHGKRAHLVLSIDLTLVAVILTLLAVGGYYAFLYKPLRDSFRFDVSSPEPLVAGREATVTLTITNTGKVRLHNTRIDAHLPAHFRISKFPEGYDPVTGMTKVATIAPKHRIELKMTGTLYGPPGEETIFVHMTANDDVGAPDEKLFSVKVRWDDNLIKGALAFPAQLVANQTFPVRFTLTNGSTQAFGDVHVVPHWPANFRVVASTPPVANGVIDIGTLGAGETVTVELLARYKGHAEDFSAEVETFWIDGAEQILLDRDVIQRSSIDVNLSVTAAFANGASVFAPGDTVPLKISYKNDSTYALKDVVFSVPLDPRFFDQKTPKLVLQTLREIPAGATGEIDATVTLSQAVSRYAMNPTFVIIPSATFSISDPPIESVIVGGTGVQAKISGTAQLHLAARYFTSEGDQLGRGPLPPRVGKETRYWVFASVTTGANDLTNGRVEIPLPNGVSWTGKQSVTAGSPLVAYEAKTATLVWTLGDIAAHTGTNDSPASASFEVVLVPEASGTTPALTTGAAFTGTDTWIGTELSAKAGPVTTKLNGDAYAQGKGIVRP